MPGMSSKEKLRWPGYTEEAHPEVFQTRPEGITYGEKPGQLSKEQVDQFFQKGWVMVKDFFSKDELGAVEEDINQLVEDLADELYEAGKIADKHSDKGFLDRLIHLQNDFPGANVLLHKRSLMLKGTQALWCNERLLNAVEQVIGPDIAGNPVWNLRTKTPHDEATTVPWHQDSAYMDNKTYQVMIASAWIPLLDTNADNGCMQMVSGSHKLGKVAMHQCCSGTTHYVILEEEEMKETLGVDFDKDVTTCAVPYGGMVLFNNVTPHRSLDNRSNVTRWSLDLRWQSPFEPYGFLKKGVVMRKKGELDFKPDWDSWLNEPSREILFAKEKGIEVDKFDPVINGFWMEKWETVNMNRHTAAQGITSLSGGGINKLELTSSCCDLAISFR